jgi:predicted DNA-binding transcriptional regulator AlpA
MLVETSDLIDSQAVAELLQLASSRAVSTYRQRYGDFPRPVVDMGAGRCLLWRRQDVEAWAASHPGRRRIPPSERSSISPQHDETTGNPE